MDEIKGQADTHNAYKHFLSDISTQAAGKEEKNQEDSVAHKPHEKDIKDNVGDRFRAVREKVGLSLQDISQRTGLNTVLLGQIEEGHVVPPLGTVIKMAKALDMKMGYFISGEEDKAYTIVRGDERKVISRYGAGKEEHYGYEYESLAPHKKHRHMEPFLVTLAPVDTEGKMSTHDGQEFIYVLKGTMEVRLEEGTHVLEPGDAIYYDSTVPHLVKCHGDKQAEILAVLYAEK